MLNILPLFFSLSISLEYQYLVEFTQFSNEMIDSMATSKIQFIAQDGSMKNFVNNFQPYM